MNQAANKAPLPGRKRAWKRKLFIAAMLIWPFIHFIIFWLYINLDTLMLSFQRFSPSKGTYVWVGLKNFSDLFKSFRGYPDDTIQLAVGNSLSLFFFNNFLLLPLSIICGYALYKRVFASTFFRVVFFLPSIISIVVLTMVFKFMFDANLGFVTPLLKAMGLGGIVPANGWFADVNTAWPMVLLYCLWAGIGYNVLLLSGALTRIPRDIIDSGRLDGLGFFRELWYITLPLIAPTISTIVIVGTTSVLTLFLQPMMLTGGGPNGSTFTIMYYITSMVKQGSSGVCSAATLGVFFSAVGIPLVLLLRKLLEKVFPACEF